MESLSLTPSILKNTGPLHFQEQYGKHSGNRRLQPRKPGDHTYRPHYFNLA